MTISKPKDKQRKTTEKSPRLIRISTTRPILITRPALNLILNGSGTLQLKVPASGKCPPSDPSLQAGLQELKLH